MKLKNNFTVVICTYNRPNKIKKSLKKILENSLSPKKIIIIDQNKDRKTSNIAKFIFKKYNFKKFKLIKNLKHIGLTKSKNLSLRFVKTKYVFFIDDDIILQKDFLKNIIKVISNKKAHGVCGVLTNYKNKKINNFFYHLMNHGAFKDNRYYFQNYKKFIKKKIYYKKINSLPGGITCFDTAIFRRLKFDEKYITHNYEDVDFCLRLKKIIPKYKFYISFNSSSIDLLDKSQKENIILRIKFMYRLFLKNRSINFSIVFILSFLGLLISNLKKLNFKVFCEIFKIFKNENVK